MKRQALMILMTLSLLVMLTAASVHAQSGAKLVANIPFEFVIGNKAFPSGKYTVKYVYVNLMQIQSEDGRQSIFFQTEPVDGKRTRSEFVFNRYGTQYFLSKVLQEGNDLGRVVKMSRSERELIQARSALAETASKPQTVSIAVARSKR